MAFYRIFWTSNAGKIQSAKQSGSISKIQRVRPHGRDIRINLRKTAGNNTDDLLRRCVSCCRLCTV